MLSEAKRRELINRWTARAERLETLAEKQQDKGEEDEAAKLQIMADSFRLTAQELKHI